MNIKRGVPEILFLAFFIIFFLVEGKAQIQQLTSPDGKITVSVGVEKEITYEVEFLKEKLLSPSRINLKTPTGSIADSPQLIKSKLEEVRSKVVPVWGIRSEILDEYNELVLKFKGGFSLIFRAYNHGVAYRFELKQKEQIIIDDETVEYIFPQDIKVLAHKVESYQTSYENFYTHESIKQLGDTLISLPFVIDKPSVKMVITEADLYDYPGLYLKSVGEGQSGVKGFFPKVSKKTKLSGWKNFNDKVVEREGFISKTNGKRSLPWRVIVISENDKGLVDNDLVYLLSRPSKMETDWVKPGLVAWDWWNNWNLTGVDFEAGVNDKTYEYYIDFASENNIPYVILDEGWSETDDLLQLKKEIDLKHLVSYAKERNVRLILWCVWHVLDRQMEEALDMFQSLDIAGVKVDFIDRDDQYAINYYERIAKEAAKRKLLVDFHGCSKPTGLHRTYPNVINYEAVRGNEYNKFSEKGIPPQHKVDIIFTRMLAGPMDFTPGATRHSYGYSFKHVNGMPMSIGTRANEMALFILYYAPLQMICDSPTAYEKNSEMLEFIREVPVTWDDTKVLGAELRETVTIARKSGNEWFVGGITNENEREVQLDFDFLETDEKYKAILFKDGINVKRNPHDYQKDVFMVRKGDKISIDLRPGGGFALRLQPTL